MAAAHLRAPLEGLVVLAALVGVSATVFLSGGWRYPHLLFPVLIWATLRFQQFGAVTSSFVVAAFAVTGAFRGTALVGHGSATEIVQILEALTAGVAVSLLILGAVLAERSGAQRELAAANASLAEAQEVAHLGSWEWDIGSDRVAWSDELYRLWGLEPQLVALTHERYLDSVHPADRDRVRTIVEHVRESATPFDFEHRIVLPDDSVRWIHASGRVISDESGVPVRMVGVGQDITERKRVDDLRDSILSAVSHELRTPLTSIIGFSVTLKDKGATLAQRTRDEMVGHLVDQASKLDRLLSDLLDLDRLRHGFMRPNLRPTDVQELATRVASDLHSNTHVIDVNGSRVIADVDAPKVERIIENLLANAVNHTPSGTKIMVSVEPQDGGVLIAVDDDGPGVADEQREAIFGIFNRGTASDRVPGTGIGLSLVAQFTALHGGSAWVEESASGGASFRVFLPGRRAGYAGIGERRPISCAASRLEVGLATAGRLVAEAPASSTVSRRRSSSREQPDLRLVEPIVPSRDRVPGTDAGALASGRSEGAGRRQVSVRRSSRSRSAGATSSVSSSSASASRR